MCDAIGSFSDPISVLIKAVKLHAVWNAVSRLSVNDSVPEFYVLWLYHLEVFLI